MSKFLMISAEVVGAVALIGTGIGAAGSLGLFGTLTAGQTATLSTIASIGKFAALGCACVSMPAALV